MTIQQHLDYLKTVVTDIRDHLPVLQRYAQGCDHIVELGVRGIVSTWAFLAANPKRVTSVDVLPPSNWGGDLDEVCLRAKEANIEFAFIQAHDLSITLEPSADLLFIDTWHIYQQLRLELDRHGPSTKKYIIMHDTVTFGEVGEGGQPGLQKAIEEFLETDPGKKWKVIEKLDNCHGLTVLGRNEGNSDIH